MYAGIINGFTLILSFVGFLTPIIIGIYSDEIQTQLKMKLKTAIYGSLSITLLLFIVIFPATIYKIVDTIDSLHGSEQISVEKEKVVEKESETERQAREQREKKEQQANKRKEIEERAYKAGYQNGFTVGPASYITDDPKYSAKILYSTWYDTPMSAEEKELCELFVKKYVEGYEEGHRNQ